MGKPENSVQFAIEDACQRFNVPCFREQSRVVTIGNRPVFYGKWRDAQGKWHTCGKADYLLTPEIKIDTEHDGLLGIPIETSVPLWVEAKAGKDRAAKPNRCMCGNTTLDHQEHFRQYVTGSGAYHLIVRDSADDLVKWFREHGVIR